MRRSQAISDAAASVEFIPTNYFETLNLAEIFSRTGAVEVDLGCGDGSFLAAAAAANPERNFLGIERLVGRVRSVCKKIARGELTNARVVRSESSYVVRHMLPPDSVAVFHLMFPDPWPKRRHHRRRVVTADLLVSIHRALVPHGTLRIATDQLDYFQEIERLAGRSSRFVMSHDTESVSALSTFGKRFHECGIEVHRVVLRKLSEVR